MGCCAQGSFYRVKGKGDTEEEEEEEGEAGHYSPDTHSQKLCQCGCVRGLVQRVLGMRRSRYVPHKNASQGSGVKCHCQLAHARHGPLLKGGRRNNSESEYSTLSRRLPKEELEDARLRKVENGSRRLGLLLA
jgi:hypothetical protein